MDIDRCSERIFELEKVEECITENPGYATCCLNTRMLSIAAINLKTIALKSYSTTKQKQIQLSQSDCLK